MGRQSETYKHFIPKLDLSIEKGTSRVPSDGRFHLLKSGKIVESFRSRKLAELKFRQLVGESGYRPETPKTQPMNTADEYLEHYAMTKDVFWAEGPKYGRGGGRGGRGGV